ESVGVDVERTGWRSGGATDTGGDAPAREIVAAQHANSRTEHRGSWRAGERSRQVDELRAAQVGHLVVICGPLTAGLPREAGRLQRPHIQRQLVADVQDFGGVLSLLRVPGGR